MLDLRTPVARHPHQMASVTYVEDNRERALRAEKWLERIQTEVEAKLLVPLATIRTEQTPVPTR